MDELDLVRLTRPPVTEPSDDVLARLRVAALGEPADGPAGDAEPLDEPAVVELAPAAAPPARSGRWRLVAAGVATAAIIAGGLAVASSRGGDDGIAAPMSDDDVRAGLVGSWSRSLDRSSATGSLLVLWPVLVTFAADGGVVVNGPCGPFVSRAHHVEAGTLVLDDPLTSPEGGCVEPAQNEAIASFVAAMSNRPTIRLDDCRTDRAASCTTLRLGDDPEPFGREVGEGDESATRPTSAVTVATTTIAGAHTPTIEELRGRRFRVTVFRTDMRAVTLQRAPELAFGDRTSLTTECNNGDAALTIVDGRLRTADWVQTAVGCPNENDIVLWLTSDPIITLDGPVMRLTTPTYDAELIELVGPADGVPATTTSVGLAPPSTFTTVPFWPPPGDAIVGRRYEGPGPVGTVRFRLDADGSLHVFYGCNEGSGDASLLGGRLLVPGLAMTAMACADPALMASETQVYRLLLDGPTLSLDGRTLVLTTPSLTLRLEEQPTPALIGTWRTNGFVQPGVTGFTGLLQVLTVSGDDTWRYEGRCTSASGTYRIDGNRVTMLPDPPGIGSPCDAPAEQVDEETRLLALLNTTVTFEIDGDVLRLTGPSGNGALFRRA